MRTSQRQRGETDGLATLSGDETRVLTAAEERALLRDLAECKRKLSEALAYLDDFIGEDGYAVGHGLTQADGAIAPQLVLANEWIPELFGTRAPLDGLPRLAAYWRAIQTDPLAARLIAETRDAIAERKAAAQAAAAARR